MVSVLFYQTWRAESGTFPVMPRLHRLVADGLLYHAINRGNNRAPDFFMPDDYRAFLEALDQTCQRYPFALFGFCLMTNHSHLLIAPGSAQSVSRILQSLTIAHTWRYHRARGTSGHVWQGRFKSPLVQSDEHALTVLRYIESNPLRAGMVTDLADYPWSSYAVHGQGRARPRVRPLPAWQELGPDVASRGAWWRKWVHTPLTEKELTRVRHCMVSGRPFGEAGWVSTVAASCGIALTSRPRGRPPKRASTDVEGG
jgi:putative transposase